MNSYKRVFQEYLRNKVCYFRKQNGISQERMSEMLQVSPRSYFDQEHGKYGFSAHSFASFLLLLPDDEVVSFLNDYRKEREKMEDYL